jgi:Carboxypeptidase regulatory-like domain
MSRRAVLTLGPRHRLGIGRALLLVVAIGAACQPGAPPASPSATRAVCSAERVAGGGIQGRVLGASGNPVNGATVMIQPVNQEFVGTATTASDGTFRSLNVSGAFIIQISAIDYQTATREVSVPCGELVTLEVTLALAQ